MNALTGARLEPIGVGIIGTGFGTHVIGPAFASIAHAEVRGVASTRLERAERAAGDLGAAFATDVPSVLFERSDVDLVCVAAPPHEHHPLVIGALEAGKHVLCEKPFGVDVDEALHMLETARRADRLHFVDFEFRTLPQRRAVDRLIRDGVLGEPMHLTITAMVDGGRFPAIRREWWQRRELGGGWLRAMGSHFLDAVRWWLGEVTEASGSLERRGLGIEGVDDVADVDLSVIADDGFVVGLRTDTGATCTIVSSATVGATTQPRIALHGTTGTAVLEGDEILTVTLADGSSSEQRFDMSTGHPSSAPLAVWAGDIVDAIRTGSQIGPNFVDGVRCQEIMAAVQQSHDDGGRRVRVRRSTIGASWASADGAGRSDQ